MPPRKTTRTYRRNFRTGPTARRTTSNWQSYACNSPRFRTAKQECQWRIGSYRNVYSQFTPAGTKTIFSPSAANKWMKYINNGALVYRFNNAQFSKYFGTRWTYSSPTATRQWMRRKYGPGIKDVTRGKGNCWLVATTKNVTARPFGTYNWK